MLDDLQNFKIDNPDAQKQMEDMLARLAVIRDQHLGPAEQGSDPRDQESRRRATPHRRASPAGDAGQAIGQSGQSAQARPDSGREVAAESAKNAGIAKPKA